MNEVKRQKRRMKKKEGGHIPTDSFSDIAFLLIIFFILTVALTQTRGILTEMPAGSTDPQTQTDKTPTIHLLGDIIRFNDDPIDMPRLNQSLAAMNLPEKPENDRVILLETERSVPYQIYFQVLSSISHHGGVVALVEEGDGE